MPYNCGLCGEIITWKDFLLTRVGWRQGSRYDGGNQLTHQRCEKCQECGEVDYSATLEDGRRVCVACCEKIQGYNYGCGPCIHLHNGCGGAKPGAFYYPHECDSFDDGVEYSDEEMGWY